MYGTVEATHGVQMEEFDIFISHNSLDKQLIDPIVQRLYDEYDIRSWLDKWDLHAAKDWEPAIKQALDSCKSCAIVLGANGWGPHHLEEARFALTRREKQSDFKVIPILLPGANQTDMSVLNDFFKRIHRVDFSNGIKDDEAFRRLVSAIKGEAPGPPPMTVFTINRAARQWEQVAVDDRASILYRGSELRSAQIIAAAHTEMLSNTAVKFLTVSAEAEQQSIQAERSRTRKIIAGLIVGLLLIASSAVFAFVQRNDAEKQRKIAQSNFEESEKQRGIAQSNLEEAERQKKQAIQNAEEREEQRKEANRQKDIAVKNEDTAKKNAAEAKRQGEIAEERRKDAERQKQVAQNEKRNAEEQREIAEKKKLEAIAAQKRAERENRLNTAQKLASLSQAQSQSNPQRAGLWAAEAIKTTLEQNEGVTSEARTAANQVLNSLTGTGHYGYFQEAVTASIFNKDETLVAATDWSGVVQVFEIGKQFPQSLQHVITTEEFSKLVTFDASNRHLVTQSRSESCGPNVSISLKTQGCGRGLIWTLDDNKKYSNQPVPLSNKPIESMAASRDNLQLAAATSQEVIIYDLADLSKHRIIRTLQKAISDSISVMEFSKDGRLLLSGSHNGWVQIWDLTSEDAKPKTVFESQHRANQLGRETIVPIQVIHIADDDAALVTASTDWVGSSMQTDLSAKLWKLNNLHPVGNPRLLKHNQAISSVNFIKSDDSIVTTSLDGGIRRWSVKTNNDANPEMLMVARCECNLLDPFKNINSAAISPDEGIIAVAASDDAIRLINLEDDSKKPVELRGHDSSSDFITISSSGKWLLSGGTDRSLRIWNIKEASLGANAGLIGDWRLQYVASELSSLGTTTALITPSQIEIWDIANNNLPRQLFAFNSNIGKDDCPACRINLSPNGKWIVVQSDSEQNQSIVIAADGSAKFTIPVRTWSVTGESQFSPDSSWLMVDEKAGGKLYDLSRLPVGTINLENNDEGIYFGSAAFSKNSKWLFAKTSLYEKTRKASGYLWRINLERRSANRIEISDFDIGHSQFSADGKWFAYSADDLGDYLERNSQLSDQTKNSLESTRVRLIRLSEEGELKPINLDGHELKPNRLVFSPNNRWLLTATSNILARDRETHVRVWDLEKENPSDSPFTLPIIDKRLAAAEFSPNGRFLVTIQSTEDFARLWHLDESRAEFVHAGILRGAIPNLNFHWSITFSPDSNRVVISTTDDSTPYLWLLSPNGSYSNPHKLRVGDQRLQEVQFSKDSNKLFGLSSSSSYIGGAQNRGMRLNMFDLGNQNQEITTEEVFRSNEEDVSRFQISQDGKQILVTGKRVRIIPIRDGEGLLDLLGKRTGRNMSWEEWVLSGNNGPYHKTFQSQPIHQSVLIELTQRVGAGEKVPGGVAINDLVDWTIEYDEPGLCNELAWALTKIKDGQQSLRASECALKHFPDDGNYRDTRGVARALLGDINGAIADFNAYIKSLTEKNEKPNTIVERRKWIEELSEGRNPFLPKVKN